MLCVTCYQYQCWMEKKLTVLLLLIVENHILNNLTGDILSVYEQLKKKDSSICTNVVTKFYKSDFYNNCLKTQI